MSTAASRTERRSRNWVGYASVRLPEVREWICSLTIQDVKYLQAKAIRGEDGSMDRIRIIIRLHDNKTVSAMTRWSRHLGVAFEARNIVPEIDYSMRPMDDRDASVGLWHIEIGTRPARFVYDLLPVPNSYLLTSPFPRPSRFADAAAVGSAEIPPSRSERISTLIVPPFNIDDVNDRLENWDSDEELERATMEVELEEQTTGGTQEDEDYYMFLLGRVAEKRIMARDHHRVTDPVYVEEGTTSQTASGTASET